MTEAHLTLLTGAALLAAGIVIGLFDRRSFSLPWLVVAAVLVVNNDAAQLRFYGWLPDYLGRPWAWEAKLVALALTLAVASLPALGWRRSGLTLRQDRHGLRSALIVTAVLLAIFAELGVLLPNEPLDGETLAFQLTMPGLEEEPFFRGVLLLALNEALRRRWRWLGVEWGWGALLSSAIFGMGHALGLHNGALSFEIMGFATTGMSALILVWLRERTGSVVLPIVAHNLANTLPILL